MVLGSSNSCMSWGLIRDLILEIEFEKAVITDIKYLMCPIDKVAELLPNEVCPPRVVIRKVKTLNEKVGVAYIFLHVYVCDWLWLVTTVLSIYRCNSYVFITRIYSITLTYSWRFTTSALLSYRSKLWSVRRTAVQYYKSSRAINCFPSPCHNEAISQRDQVRVGLVYTSMGKFISIMAIKLYSSISSTFNLS